jgi:hypothetical protein
MRWTFAALMVVALAATADGQPRTGQDLIRTMHDRYAATWYPTLSFVQSVVYADGRPGEDWWEALGIPGRLRIDTAPIDAPSRTVIYRGDTRYIFEKGKLTSSSQSPNFLLVLGFDVYRQSPETTTAFADASRITRPSSDTLRAHSASAAAMRIVGSEASQRRSACELSV